jgi:hypothetical protein
MNFAVAPDTTGKNATEFDRAKANCETGITGPGNNPGGQPRITGEINRGGTVGIHAVRS